MSASKHGGSTRRTVRVARGLTLIEILVVLAIVAVLIGVATSGMHGFMARRAVDTAISDLASDYRLARSEAVKRSNYVTICRSPNGLTCGADFGSWHDGWLVVVDLNANRQVDPGEEVLRVQPPLEGIQRIARANGDFNNTKQSTQYRPNGVSVADNETLVLIADPSIVGGTRKFVISRNGRVAVRPIGDTLP